MKFCEKVKEARTKAGLKQDDLAKAIGVSLRTISNYEAGTRYPKKRTSSVISGIFWECTFYSSLWRSSTLPECLSSSRPNPHLQARRLQKAP